MPARSWLALALRTPVVAALALPAGSAMRGRSLGLMMTAGVTARSGFGSRRYRLSLTGVKPCLLLVGGVKEILDPLLLKDALLALQVWHFCHGLLCSP